MCGVYPTRVIAPRGGGGTAGVLSGAWHVLSLGHICIGVATTDVVVVGPMSPNVWREGIDRRIGGVRIGRRDISRRTAMIGIVGRRFGAMHIESKSTATHEAAGPSTARISIVRASFHLAQHYHMACAIDDLSECLPFVDHRARKNSQALAVFRRNVRRVVALAKTYALFESPPARRGGN